MEAAGIPGEAAGRHVVATGQRLEQDASELDAERDVLAQERDALKAALTRAGQRSGNSILPYKGPNGTWRRPIVIECVGNVAKLQPRGQTFSMMELSPLINPRSSPVVLAIAREMLHIERAGTPDGSPVVPYLVFMVRPNGIRPYYEVRARLEPLGIAFGYELVEQDLAVDIPDYDDLTTWDGSAPLDIAPSTARPQTGWPSTSATDAPGRNRTRAPAVLPPEPPAMAGEPGCRAHGRRPATAEQRGSGPGPAGSRYPTRGGRSESGSNPNGNDPGPMPEVRRSPSWPWERNPGRGYRAAGAGGPGSDGNSPEDFVWPSNSRRMAALHRAGKVRRTGRRPSVSFSSTPSGGTGTGAGSGTAAEASDDPAGSTARRRVR